jgi:thiamine biosynthesis lipoprotein
MVLGCGLLAVGFLSAACGSRAAVHKRSEMIMGTVVEITTVSRDEPAADEAMTAAFREIRRLDNLLSTYKESSAVSEVNRAAGRRAVAVGEEVLKLVGKALEVADLTEGGFNIAIGPAVTLWSVTDQPHLPSADEIEAVRPFVDVRRIRADGSENTLFLEQSGMRIDVGGIGKGYASDRAVAVLKQHGIAAGIVAVAGDIMTFGKKPDGRPWRVAIRHPRRDDAPLTELDLSDEAVSTSGDYERYFIMDGKRYHHILDPKTLYPAAASQSVTIVAREAIWADALATGVFVMGPEKGMALIERLPNVEGLIVDQTGNIHVSTGLKSRITLSEKGGTS